MGEADLSDQDALSPYEWTEAVRIAGRIYTNQELAVWLNAPQPLLDNWTPIQLLGCGKGHELLRVMKNLEDGAFL